MATTAADVKRLRDATGAGMMDAKRALDENEGDFDTAAQWLREKGIAKAAARTDRENSDGAVGVFLDRDKGIAALVELKCETDFVAKNAEFVNFAADIAAAVAENGEGAVAQKKDDLDSLVIVLKENIEVGKVARLQVAAGNAVDLYAHEQDGRVKNGVLIEIAGAADAEAGVKLAHDIAVHCAFARPTYLSRDAVPEDVVASERATFETIARNEGKPEAALAKIVEGRVNGFFKDACLLDQSYVKDEKQSITQLLGGATLVRFAQVEIGAQ